MARKGSVLVLLAVLVVFGLSFTSCATSTSIGGTSGPHGLFGGNSSANQLTAGAEEIASYSVILMLIDSGYAEFAAAVRAAKAEGRTVVSVTRNMLFLQRTTAYALP